MTHEETGRNEFGQELRRLREQAGLTQVQLAARLGYHHSYVSKIESGAREPRIAFADKADDLLAAGGSLLAVATRIRARLCAGLVASAGEASVPLPRAPHGADQLRPSLTRYVRLPAFGVICPSHGINGCAAPVPGGLAEVPGVDGLTVGAETLHGFAALLTTYLDADISEVAGDLAVPVERALRTLTTLVPMARGAQANGLLQLAARYADLAGWLRVKRGQHGIAMTWLHRSVEWALASGGVATACEALSSMGVLAMIEGDAATALDYSGAAAAVDRNRRWMGVHAQLNQARAHAMLGDHREFARLSRAAQRAADQFDDRDRIEAPWLTGAAGATYVASHLAGGLRDLAEVTGRSVIADRAVMYAETSLANVPARMHGSRLMLTLRLADSQACRGDLDAAVELARPVMAAVTSAPATPIRHELSRLRTRLGTRFAELLDSI
ncbi:Helix-turn-helix domain-containing protein [Lentzea albidocapillata subsp. violacea]|uniref:Helix-turn-helix domain-containing protein n=1 Tax=Lentzea albidocapillata subsp. violacea TaxID=128104 RepID=A0A1G8QHL5_9PSEU|nr:helix-turn-helix transcriptional regulator [Lentzea albidocapillata]SDJ03580.1 Helix-turn-helix domain-containing protein [Lentzea albidocapillata subsp. violacea]